MESDSRPESPSAPPQDLWSSILDSVSSTRSIPSKQILLLGQPGTGKSTLSNALLQKEPESSDQDKTDFALGYDWADVRDEGDESDTLARLSVFTVPSSQSTYTSLLPHFINPQTNLQHSLIMIVLDWTKPWTFVDELQTWLGWIDKWAHGSEDRELVIAREEARERLQYYLQHYTDPSIPASTSIAAAANTAMDLAEGTFTMNEAGVPIVFVCTKADQIDEDHAGKGMVKGKGEDWEERTDGIMQVLRTIALLYGAGVFYTTLLPETLATLRQYALHMLFIPPAPSPTSTLPISTSTSEIIQTKNPFRFAQKPNTLDRDRIIIPIGWDSAGKITVMREGFDVKAWQRSWTTDNSAEEDTDQDGVKAMYSRLAPDQSIKDHPLPPLISPTPETTFLSKHYDENAKKPDRDPRGAFRNPNDMVPGGIVGPVGGSFLPNVERVLTEMEASASLSSSTSRRPAAARPGNIHAGPASLSPRENVAAKASPSPTGQTQHEVLQNFFQSLLSTSSKDRAAGPPGAPPAPSASKKVNGGAPARDTASPGAGEE
ncbi:dynein light intermediate chain-domain-containing protein [Schizophyllum amplum]|uniref:Dynein light intermediate chain-domain-containing protein n=1 Tax=Schizophyllum amplum TaxID=97359 RepID=A0A550CSZ8_9AGAR|nr:dynein light intermediate chain-domain-containing protein [Auriculariopsis ampla]